MKGEWVQNFDDWISVEEFERGMVPTYSWGKIVSEEEWNSLFTKARIRRESDILRNVLKCRSNYNFPQN